MMLENQR